VSTFQSRGKYVVACRDVSERVACEDSIHRELANYQKLLAEIMPTPVIARLQSDRGNVSFSVQMATIVFMNFVGFSTPMDALAPQTVIAILGELWEKFDRIISGTQTMTKIKSYGDCFMAAGGLFSEAQQSRDTHAKEGVAFGLSAIAAVEQINRDRQTDLKLRVGVHMGGPIIAGVLGISKQSFDIFGDPINEAKMMEQIGVPMPVLVSRKV
jgi:class 3 adenylate cyclase